MIHSLSVFWDINPELLSIGPLSIRYYGILFGLGFLIGLYMMQGFFKREQLPLSLLDSLFWTLILSTLIGARLGHVLFYEPKEFLADPIEILKFWHGGLASHGGSIGILIGVWLYVRKQGRKHGFGYIWLLDRIAIPTALAACFIRLGNLMNSEIYGVETSLPWGFIFALRGEMVPKHPTQLYEALSYLLIFFLLLWLYRHRLPKLKNGMFLGTFLTLVFSARFLIEFIKNPQEPFEVGMTLDMGQWLSIPFVLFGVGLLVYGYTKGRPAMLLKK